MKVAVVAPSPVPFASGGAERIWNGLVREIERQTEHDAELIKIPTPERTLIEVVAGYERFWHLDVSHFDAVITGKYPAWMIRHPGHIVYMLHPLRGLYDTYPSSLPTSIQTSDPGLARLADILMTPPDQTAVDELFGRFWELVARQGGDNSALAFPGPLARRIVHYLDAVALRPAAVRRHAAISRTVAGRPGYLPAGVDVTVVHPPSDLEGYRCEDFEYFLAPGRLEHPKRVQLLVEAMRLCNTARRLVICGTGPEEERLRAAANGDSRIAFVGRSSSEELIGLYARALAVLFAPQDEDYGLVTVEAMSSAKPVLTTDDAGGPTELVEDRVTGAVVRPDPASIAAAMEWLGHDVQRCRDMGRAARSRVATITWSGVLDALLGPRPVAGSSRTTGGRPRSSRPPVWRRPGSPKLVVASTFPTYPLSGGGQLRNFGLYGALSSIDVEILSMDVTGAPGRVAAYRPGFIERAVAKTEEQVRFEAAESAHAGVLVTDIVAAEAAERTPELRETLRASLRDADAVLLAHPYMHPLVRSLDPRVPFVYDAHNAEFALKAGVFASSPQAGALLARVEQIEGAAIRDAMLVTACSEKDAAALAAHYGIDRGRMVVAPNGVDTARVRFVSGEERVRLRQRWLDVMANVDDRRRQCVALFLGSWHPPNITAAQRIIEMAPRLPEVLFLLVGSHCEAFRHADVPANVRLMGTLPAEAVRTLTWLASVGLNPVVEGAGTNLKMFEYFAAGLPVVSTPVGIRGTAAEDFVHVRVQTIDTFVQGIRHLVANPDEADGQAAAARALVADRYDWRVIGSLMEKRILMMLNSERSDSLQSAPVSV